MFSQSPANLPTQDNVNKSHRFAIKGQNSYGIIERVKNPNQIDKESTESVLVESFIGEYEKYLSPNEVGDSLSSWRDGEQSVKKYYEDYFKTELEDFMRGDLHYWVQASVDGKLVGWATFQREKSDQNAVYMNLLVVRPEYQNKGIGAQLVNALVNLNEIQHLNAIHILLRKKNKGGKLFYSKLGFTSDPEYQREDNFVNLDLLEGFTWKNPAPQNKSVAYFSDYHFTGAGKSTLFKIIGPLAEEQNKQQDTYCGFEPGFLLGKRF